MRRLVGPEARSKVAMRRVPGRQGGKFATMADNALFVARVRYTYGFGHAEDLAGLIQSVLVWYDFLTEPSTTVRAVARAAGSTTPPGDRIPKGRKPTSYQAGESRQR